MSTLDPSRSTTRRLDLYDNSGYDPGGSFLKRLLWYYCSLMLFESGWMPSSGIKCRILRWFGAVLGNGVVIKPHVRIKYPWRLVVGDFVWIGQDAWLDNLDNIRIESHAVISQGVYLCTGSHDRHLPTFDLIVKPIVVEAGSWVCARAVVLQGVTVGANAVVAAGAVVSKDVEPGGVVKR